MDSNDYRPFTQRKFSLREEFYTCILFKDCHRSNSSLENLAFP